MMTLSQITRYRVKREFIFPACTAILSLVLFFSLLDIVFVVRPHPLYNSYSLSSALLGSLVIFALSFKRSILLRLFCVLLSAFYTQRFIVTYWFPDQLDYDYYVHFTYANIEASSNFYLFCILAIGLGALIGDILSTKTSRAPVIQACANLPESWQKITYFGFTVSFEKLCSFVLMLMVPLYVSNFLVYMSGFGLVGTVYSSDETVLKWFLGIASALGPFVLFSFIYFTDKKKIKKRAKWALILVVLNGLILSQKGFLLEWLLSWYLIVNLLGRKVSKYFFLFAGALAIISIFVFFPAMMMMRYLLMSGEMTFDYFKSLGDALFLFLNRLGGYDWLNLWVSVPASEIPPNASIFSEGLTLLNRLIPGEIIPQPDKIDLAKLQVWLGRGYGWGLDTLGANGEVMGGLGSAYVFCGQWGGLVYLTVLIAFLLVIERSSVHPMHKYILISNYTANFLIGGGFTLMSGGMFWFLIFTTFFVVVVKARPSPRHFCQARAAALGEK